ncbi:MAG: tail protein [Podoviridae sp. ctbd591]|nr:MAG: tail protein [Podoviridae sp. ctbd591]
MPHRLDFEPTSTVCFGQVGIDTDQKIFIEAGYDTMRRKCEQLARENAHYFECESLSYVRTGPRMYVAVDVDFYQLQYCDTIWYFNQTDGESLGVWWIGHIVQVEWVNPNCNYVHYEIDAYSTFAHRINWHNSVCYVEREHVKGDWVNGNPAFSNMGPAESINVNPDVVLSSFNKHFKADKVLVYTPFNKTDYKPNFGSRIHNGIYDAMNAYVMDAGEAAQYLQGVAESEEADISAIQGIYTFPSEFENANGEAHDERIDLPWVNPPGDYPEINNSKCWSGQFCRIRLMSWLGGAIDYNPQWFGGGKDSMPFSYRGFLSAGELTIQATLKPARETFTWDGYKDFILTINQLPQAHWIGNGFAQYQATWMMADVLSSVAGVNAQVGGVAGDLINPKTYMNPIAGAANLASSTFGAVATISGAIANINQHKQSGLVVGGSKASDPNSAMVQGHYGFTVVAYGCQPYLIKTIDAFFDRFGYNVNTLKTPETHSRPFWNFVKTREAHVAGDIPFLYRRQIENMLNEGVTFWNPDNVTRDHPIGDFSDAKRNKES